MDNIEYTISRYELHPPDRPTCIAVGFLAKDLTTGNTGTLETLVSLSDTNGKTQSEVCNLAFSNLTWLEFKTIPVLTDEPVNSVLYTVPQFFELL